MDLKKLKAAYPKIRITENASMAECCSFRAGGTAEALVEVGTIPELKGVLKYVNANNIDHLILGNGTNTLFADGVYHGIVIKQKDSEGDFGTVTIDDAGNVKAGAAVLLSALSRMVITDPWSFSGMEGLSGIPGSVGGAVFMNAGAYGYEMKDVLVSAHAVSADGEDERDFSLEEIDPGYRHSAFMENGYIITNAVLKLKEDKLEDIKARIADFTEKRVTKQPLKYPSAGSSFKRREGYFAGKLIEDSGLKGLTVGGAQVSQLHAGFIINVGGATATDIIDLMSLVQNTVYDKFGVRLEPEVRIIGK